jgi:hypothetical protein
MRRPLLPSTIGFDGLGECYFKIDEYRPPKRGEYFASGAIPFGYKAFRDMTSPAWVVVPTFKARIKTIRTKGAPVGAQSS